MLNLPKLPSLLRPIRQTVVHPNFFIRRILLGVNKLQMLRIHRFIFDDIIFPAEKGRRRQAVKPRRFDLVVLGYLKDGKNGNYREKHEE